MKLASTTSLSLVALCSTAGPLHAQSFNVDLQPTSSPLGVPSVAYGAGAAQPGVWNPVGSFDVTLLLELAGAATSVTLRNLEDPKIAGWVVLDHPAVTGDDSALLEDSQEMSIGEGGTWQFAGLEPGDYEVFTYGWTADNPGGFTRVGVRFAAEPAVFINDPWPGGQVEGITYARHRVNVNAGGRLSIQVEGNPFGLPTVVNGFQLVRLPNFTSYCFGPSVATPGCTACPCGITNLSDTPGGCRNSTFFGSILYATGVPSVSNDSLRFEVRDMVPSTSGTLFSGLSQLPTNPANPCFAQASGIPNAGDGLRCMGVGVLRHGARGSDAFGDVGVSGPGWGGGDGPIGGLVAAAGAVAGQTRYYQVLHRDDPAQVCGSGINSTQGVAVTFAP